MQLIFKTIYILATHHPLVVHLLLSSSICRFVSIQQNNNFVLFLGLAFDVLCLESLNSKA